MRLRPPAPRVAEDPDLETVSKAIFNARENHAWEDEPEIERENKWYSMDRTAINVKRKGSRRRRVFRPWPPESPCVRQ